MLLFPRKMRGKTPPSREQNPRGKRVPVELNEAVRKKLTRGTETGVARKTGVAVGDRPLFDAGPALNGNKPVRIGVREPVIDRENRSGTLPDHQ